MYTVDNNFVPQLAAGMCSIFENNKAEDAISIYVFSNGITRQNQQKLTEFTSTYNRNVVFINIVGFMDKLGFDFDTSGWNEIVLARLLMARFLPASIHRVLYLDGDTIVRGTLAPFYYRDMQSNTLSMVMEPTASQERRNGLGIGDLPYFNAGVLLVDLDRWRSTNAEGRLLAFCKEKGDRLFANDQDAINVVLAREILPAAPKYNYSNVFDYYPYKMLKECMPDFCSEQEYDDSVKSPCIVHFLGEDRPWRKGNTHRFSKDYYRYLQKTPWKNTPQETGWETYYVLWGIFNILMRPFPKLRLSIINGLIPAFMKYRSRQRRKNEQ